MVAEREQTCDVEIDHSREAMRLSDNVDACEMDDQECVPRTAMGASDA